MIGGTARRGEGGGGMPRSHGPRAAQAQPRVPAGETKESGRQHKERRRARLPQHQRSHHVGGCMDASLDLFRTINRNDRVAMKAPLYVVRATLGLCKTSHEYCRFWHAFLIGDRGSVMLRRVFLNAIVWSIVTPCMHSCCVCAIQPPFSPSSLTLCTLIADAQQHQRGIPVDSVRDPRMTTSRERGRGRGRNILQNLTSSPRHGRELKALFVRPSGRTGGDRRFIPRGGGGGGGRRG